MPEVFRQGGLRYFFNSNEGLPGRTLGVPLARFPRLFRATPIGCAKVEISRTGLDWESLDKDISIAADCGARRRHAKCEQRGMMAAARGFL